MEPRITIRPERPDDSALIADVVRRAYAHVAYSDHREHLMVERLRSTAAYIPSLSLLAEIEGEAAGHVLLTRAFIRNQPPFGYELLRRYPITLPFDAPDENCMILSLFPRALEGVAGQVEYAKGWLDH